jgi:hypothetical protein
MNYQATAEAIRTHFIPLWDASAFSAVPLTFDNRTFANPGVGQSFVRVTVVPVDRQVVGYGALKNWRTFGEVMFDILIPDNVGDARAREIADFIGGVFEGQNIDGISFRQAVFYGEVLSDAKHTTYQLRVVYDVDELKA